MTMMMIKVIVMITDQKVDALYRGLTKLILCHIRTYKILQF